MKKIFCFSLGLLMLMGCDPAKKLAQPQEITFLDTMEITTPKPEALKTAEDYNLPRYNPSHTQVNDLLHTKLELSFDWKNEAVKGIATLQLKPWFYPTKTLTLDAQGFDVSSVRMTGRTKNLNFKNENNQLIIDLGKSYSARETYEIVIDYTAYPARLPVGGSEAITSDQGLFFINADGADPNKPQQIWTQGETEYNSRWFPTVDKPNERCTQEMYLTVQDRFTTLSNGLLINSTKNTDGTRTDYWKMDIPHAPYLFMLAIGEYAVVKDSWNGIPVDYYVEPAFEKDAKAIFNHTTEMLQFFSDKIGVTYPWPKYSQVVVRDFVSGAMENTSAVIYGEFVQRSTKELIGESNDRIVAHELFHHWFGDLVTCESWANLTMNEGFANYSEYLWYEHKYGKEEADNILRGDQLGYIESTSLGGMHPLIHYGYDNKESMFDAHSYNKGGAVLHMLRNEIGDEAFFTALKLYLERHKFTSVEVHDLRLAFEDVTGRDLSWFFNQWYLAAGHPQVEIDYNYDEVAKTINIDIKQEQDPIKAPPVFILPMAVDIYVGSKKPIRKNIVLEKREQSFSFAVDEAPEFVNIDAEKTILWEKKEKRAASTYLFQYHNAKNYRDKYEALNYLAENQVEGGLAVFEKALGDSFWGIRRKSLNTLSSESLTPGTWQQIIRMAASDTDVRVREVALDKIVDYDNPEVINVAQKALDQEKTYQDIAGGLKIIAAKAPDKLDQYVSKYGQADNMSLIMALGGAFGKLGDVKNLNYFESKLPQIKGFDVFPFFEPYTELALAIEDDGKRDELSAKMKALATNNDTPQWTRFCCARMIATLRDDMRAQGNINQGNKLAKDFTDIKAWERNDQLKGIYNRF